MLLGTAAARGDRRNVGDFCKCASGALQACKPRKLWDNGEKAPVLVFTDGSWESGRAGLGAVVVDVLDNSTWVYSGQVPDWLLEKWTGLVLIC